MYNLVTAIETISRDMMHGGADYTPYDGLKVTGWPVTTIVRGKPVVRDGVLVGKVGHGMHLPRERSTYARPAATG